jgi:hypothetical protein
MKPIVSKLSVLIPGEQAFAPEGECLRLEGWQLARPSFVAILRDASLGAMLLRMMIGEDALVLQGGDEKIRSLHVILPAASGLPTFGSIDSADADACNADFAAAGLK